VRPLPLPTVIDSHSGDLLLLITDHYRVKDWDALAQAMESENDVDGDRASGWSRFIDCEDGARRSTVAINLGKSVGKDADRIELFYKTQAYADLGRPWFEALAAGAVEFAGRAISDPKGLMKNLPAGGKAKPAPETGLPPEVMAEAIEQALHRSYAHWADKPLPALGDKTPRQAIATPAGLERVKGLLRSYEDSEKRMAAEQGRREIPFAFLWDAIGLKQPDA